MNESCPLILLALVRPKCLGTGDRPSETLVTDTKLEGHSLALAKQ